MPNQEPYPSDLNDVEWELLRPLLNVPPKLGRPPRHDRRLVLNAIFYVVRSGCAWRLLPHDLPLRSSTRRVLRWLTTPECEATMRERRSEGENGIWW